MSLEKNKGWILLKSCIYRLVGSLTTVIIAFLITGKIEISFAIGILELFSKIFLYWIYDISWSKFTNSVEMFQTKQKDKPSDQSSSKSL